MNEVAKVLFLENCGTYALESSIAVNDQTARVVTLRDLEEHLEDTCPNFLVVVNACYMSLENFLKRDGKQIVRAGLIQHWRDWQYEIMDHERYKRDRRHQYGMFSDLSRLCSYDTMLLVLYRRVDQARFLAQRKEEKKVAKAARLQQQQIERQKEILLAEQIAKEQQKQEEIEQAKLREQQKQETQATLVTLDDQIMQLYQREKMTQQFWANSRSLITRIQMLIDSNYPGRGHKVTPFGSTANRLSLRNADLDLCIRVGDDQLEYDKRQNRHKILHAQKSIYNMKHLAALFRSIGMLEVEAITNAKVPICKFIDPVTRIRCDINTHNVLGIENTQLIEQYIDMDKRIRPLITVIKYFVKEKNLNSAVGGTLNSYAYVIMVLHFLIVGLQNPVLPCLQDLNQIKCSSPQCKSKRNPRAFSNFMSQDQQNCDLRYHDCVRVHNINAREYGDPNSPIGNNKIATPWYGFNTDSVAELLHKFFHYYSDPRNYILSIIRADGELVGVSEDDRIFRNNHFVIQDPFIRRKNLARTCTEVGSRAILKEFQRAAKLTAPHLPPYSSQLSSICDRAHTLAKPLDTLCMEYKLKNKQGKMALKQQHNIANGHEPQDQVIAVFEEITQDDFEQQLFDIAQTPSTDSFATSPTITKAPLTPEPAVATKATHTLLDDEIPNTPPQHPTISVPPHASPMATASAATTTSVEGNRTTTRADTISADTSETEMPILRLIEYLLDHYRSIKQPFDSLLQERIKYLAPTQAFADYMLQGLERFTAPEAFKEQLLERPILEKEELMDIFKKADFTPRQLSFLVAQLIHVIDAYIDTVYDKEEKENTVSNDTSKHVLIDKRSDRDLFEVTLFGTKLSHLVEYLQSDDDGFLQKYDPFGAKPNDKQDEDEDIPSKNQNTFRQAETNKKDATTSTKTADNTLKQTYASIMTKTYSNDSEIDVFFLVSDVPDEINSYELVQEFAWYGQVLECKRVALFGEDDNNDATRAKNSNSTMHHFVAWHVHMRTFYEAYTSGKLFNISLNIDWTLDHGKCRVSLPSLLPLC